MAWRDWFRPGPSAVVYKRFFDAGKYAHEHNMTAAEALRHIGCDTDLVRTLSRSNIYALMRRKLLENQDLGDIQPELGEGDNPFLQLMSGTAASISALARCSARLTLKRANFPENMEGDQASLAYLWAEMVIRHYTELVEFAAVAHIPMDREQTTRLFRQVCYFYNVLWWYRLHQRILDTGRVPRDQMSGYLEEFKEATEVTLLIHENVPIGPEDMVIYRLPEEVEEDHAFYLQGKLSKPYYEEDYAKVLHAIDVEKDGTTREATARLHFRTCQVLDLSHKIGTIDMDWWWRWQSDLAGQNLDQIINKIVPLPNF